MGIQTDSTPLEEPKNPDTDTIFALYKLMASEEQIIEMRSNYESGNYGYGHAKQALYELIITTFSVERAKYNHYMNTLNEIDEALAVGAEKAKKVAKGVLKRVRKKLGY
jgi:tryptophanyl-tRNA synthetase